MPLALTLDTATKAFSFEDLFGKKEALPEALNPILQKAVELATKRKVTQLDVGVLGHVIGGEKQAELVKRLASQLGGKKPATQFVKKFAKACEPKKGKGQVTLVTSGVVACSDDLLLCFNAIKTSGSSINWQRLFAHLVQSPPEAARAVIRQTGVKEIGSKLATFTGTAKRVGGKLSKTVAPHPMERLPYEEMTGAEYAGKTTPLVGQKGAVQAIIRILNKQKNRNPLLVGPAGVGKTQIVAGLAKQIAEGEFGDSSDSNAHWLSRARIWEIPASSLTSGIKDQGEVEKRVDKLLAAAHVDTTDRSKGITVLFIDEIHALCGVKAPGSNILVIDMLKTKMATGELVIIGATTIDEVKPVRANGAFWRRVTQVTIKPPTDAEALTILRPLVPSLARDIGISPQAEPGVLGLCVEWAKRYGENALPASAIKLVEGAASLVASLPYVVKTTFHALVIAQLKLESLLLVERFEGLSHLDIREVRAEVRVVMEKVQQHEELLDRLLGKVTKDGELRSIGVTAKALVGEISSKIDGYFDETITGLEGDARTYEQVRRHCLPCCEISLDATDITKELSRVFGVKIARRVMNEIMTEANLSTVFQEKEVTLFDVEGLVGQLAAVDGACPKDAHATIAAIAGAFTSSVKQNQGIYEPVIKGLFELLKNTILGGVKQGPAKTLKAATRGDLTGVGQGLAMTVVGGAKAFGSEGTQYLKAQVADPKLRAGLQKLLQDDGYSLLSVLQEKLPEDSLVSRVAQLFVTSALKTNQTELSLKALGVPLPPPMVTRRMVANVVMEDHGIPVEHTLTANVSSVVQQLDTVLRQRVIGQPMLVNEVSAAMRKAAAGVAPEDQPQAVIFIPGPTGCGKTYITNLIAEHYFGPDQITTLHGPDYSDERMGPARLTGSSVGFVGSSEDSPLTPLRRNGYRVLFIDEAEKMHRNVLQMLLQALDGGWMEDAKGRIIRFHNTVVIFAVNSGQEQMLAEGLSLFPNSSYLPSEGNIAACSGLIQQAGEGLPESDLIDYLDSPDVEPQVGARVHRDRVSKRLATLAVAINRSSQRDDTDPAGSEDRLYKTMATVMRNSFKPRFQEGDRNAVLEIVRGEPNSPFTREFLGRCTICPALPLTDDGLRRVTDLEIDRWVASISKRKGLEFEISPVESRGALVELILGSLDADARKEGARPVKRAVQRLLGEAFAETILRGLIGGTDKKIRIVVPKGGDRIAFVPHRWKKLVSAALREARPLESRFAEYQDKALALQLCLLVLNNESQFDLTEGEAVGLINDHLKPLLEELPKDDFYSLSVGLNEYDEFELFAEPSALFASDLIRYELVGYDPQKVAYKMRQSVESHAAKDDSLLVGVGYYTEAPKRDHRAFRRQLALETKAKRVPTMWLAGKQIQPAPIQPPSERVIGYFERHPNLSPYEVLGAAARAAYNGGNPEQALEFVLGGGGIACRPIA